jgi:hypothetical protein
MALETFCGELNCSGAVITTEREKEREVVEI